MAAVTEFVSVARLEAGKLKFTGDRLAHLHAGLQRMADGEVILTVSHPKATRDARLNRLYWAGYVGPMAEYTGYTPREMHEYFKQRFLCDKAKRLVFSDQSGEVVADAVIPILTTTTLTPEEFKQYLRDIETMALDLGVRVGSNREGVA